ncbi:cell filamentation protein Fic [Tenacibaculum finnmarkense genomovar ulcerans]|uniref:Fic family protein n=1 Tax=Tenacibaculum TaxID=104267 RepID=UPI00187B7DA8|nr:MULTISPECIES: Fic family protein [Tenacibaculum]MBE7634961.1 cell filamentation protein Fic [Tenacibaculum finnmarkense genomovar ulcerans]MCD8403786.1 Fic family protein [Tenacibaculum finnmarkense genomovar finnmarkense]MCD8430874.1 Fic family protein [Tenacibaculum finnmarkense genomovar ulcerans]
MKLLETLQEEKSSNLKGGIYHKTQIRLAYNTNRIEGSKLSEEQTRYIYETNTLFTEEGENTANIDDIIETVNHFHCFDYMLKISKETLSEKHIKEFHKLLKINTSDSKKEWFNVGAYKSKPNIVGGIETSKPNKVKEDIDTLLKIYNKKENIEIFDIIDFHYEFEKIHPFQDGNGRVGRLIIFKECLKHNIVPFIIQDEFKFFYYRGLSEYPKIKGYLTDTCLSAQDNYKELMKYFEIEK